MRMSKKTYYQSPPPLNYELRFDISVGTMNRTFAEKTGPQRNRPQDSNRWRSSLASRARAYGKYNPVLLRPRVASYRGDADYYPLDGNGSNHWLEGLYGPDFKPHSGTYVVDLRKQDGTPDYAAENLLMQDVQVAKNMTVTERFSNNREFDNTSKAAKFGKAVAAAGFVTGPQTTDARVLGFSVTTKVASDLGAEHVTHTLNVIRECFPSLADTFNWSEPADNGAKDVKAKWAAEAKEARMSAYERTNGSLVVSVAQLLASTDYDNERLKVALRSKTAAQWSEGARGRGAESIVKPRIEAVYETFFGK